jgi:transketolase
VQDTSAAHGKALSPDQLADLKRKLGWPEDEMFLVPEKAAAHMAACTTKGAEAEQAWNAAMDAYAAAHPEPAAELRAALAGELPDGWDADLPVWTPDDGAIATRSAAGKTLNAIRANCAQIVGGAADLASSTSTMPTDKTFMQAGAWDNPNVRFGVREFAMSAACNGIALHGGLRALGSTFLAFADYCRPALRLAALMGLPTVHQFTHDSIGLGEDGPTHQPVEQVASLRAIPNFTVIRPADANETAEAWRAALLNTGGPTAIIGSRQNLPVLQRCASCPAALLHMGAYVLRNCDGTPDVLLMASGSEVALTLRAADALATDGIKSRVISFPSWELFEKQNKDWRDAVLPPGLKVRLAVEAGSPQGWHKYVGSAGDIVALDRFGASGPGPEVYEALGFSVDEIVARAKALLVD